MLHILLSASLKWYRSLVVDHLKEQREFRNIGLVYVYLDHEEEDAQDQHDIRRSFIHQLARCANRPYLPFIEIYRRHDELDAINLIDELWKHIPSFLSSFERVFFVMDGLDEYVSLMQKEIFMELIDQLRGNNLSLLITSRSRMEGLISNAKNSEELLVEASDDDLKAFCNHALKAYDGIIDMDIQFQQYVADRIILRANGM